MYYIAKVKFETVDDNTGRIRKIKEQYVVDAESITDAEEICKDRFKDSIAEFSVSSIQESQIMGILMRR
jgi:hypothetical protein